MSRLRSSIIKRYTKAVDKARDALSSDIIIYYKTGNKLTITGSSWDPVNEEYVDPNREDGNVYRDEILSKTIKASTSWVGLSDKYMPIRFEGGQLNRNDVIISCKLTDVLFDPTTVSGETYFHKATKIEINGVPVYPRTTPLKYGLAGSLYSCALVASLDSTV